MNTIDIFETQLATNTSNWSKIIERESYDIDAFLKLEAQELKDLDLNESYDIDLPSLCINDDFNQDISFISEEESYQAMETKTINKPYLDDIQSKLVQKLFPSSDLKRITKHIVPDTTELELELSKTKQLYAKMKRERDDLERKYNAILKEKVCFFNFRIIRAYG